MPSARFPIHWRTVGVLVLATFAILLLNAVLVYPGSEESPGVIEYGYRGGFPIPYRYLPSGALLLMFLAGVWMGMNFLAFHGDGIFCDEDRWAYFLSKGFPFRYWVAARDEPKNSGFDLKWLVFDVIVAILFLQLVAYALEARIARTTRTPAIIPSDLVFVTKRR